MAQLEWKNWRRTPGCREWMDKTTFAGVSFSHIFWMAMRIVFMDENGKRGLLYRGRVFAEAEKIVAKNGRMLSFNRDQMQHYLLYGDFIFNQNFPLIFEGPSTNILNEPHTYAATPPGSRVIQIHFYNIIKDASYGTGAFRDEKNKVQFVPQNEKGIMQLAYFTAAIVLHEIMHSHNFNHNGMYEDWKLGTDYSSTLTGVAYHAVVNAGKAEMLDPGPKWNGWENLKGLIIGDVAALCVPGTNITDIYVRGTDSKLHQMSWQNRWIGWHCVDTAFILQSSPAAVSSSASHRGIYASGKDGNVYHKYWDGKWHGWQNLGGQIIGDVAAVCIPGTNKTELYVRGLDNTLYQNVWDNGWSGWLQVDPSFKLASSPSVVANNTLHRGVYATGQDGNVYHKYWDGKKWYPWQNLSGRIIGDVSAIGIQGTNITELYVRGMDSTLYRNIWNKGWSGWIQVDPHFKLSSSPSAVSAHAGHRAIYATGADGHVYHKSFG